MYLFPSQTAGLLYRRLFFLLPFLVFFSATHAQTTGGNKFLITLSPEDRSRGLNGDQSNFYFALDNSTDYQNAGYFGQRIRPYLADNPEAVDYLNSYRRQKALLLGERAVFVGSIVLYGQQVLASDMKEYFNNKQKVIVGVAAASLLSNIFISRNTNRYFQRAVEEHNSSLPISYHNLWQRLSPTAIGLTAPTGRPQLAIRWSLR